MKKLFKTTTIIIFLITINSLSISLYAQDPPPPPPSHGSSGNVPGGGAPIGSGLLILAALGAGYGAKKVYDFKKNKLAE